MDIKQHFHMDNAKYVACILVLLSIVVHMHFHSHLSDRAESCDVLFRKGNYDPNTQTWHPGSCKLHAYSKQDIRSCFQYEGKTQLVFIGGNAAYKQYSSLIKSATGDKVPAKLPPQNLTYTSSDNHLLVEFITNHDVKSLPETWKKHGSKFSTKPKLVIVSTPVIEDSGIDVKQYTEYLRTFVQTLSNSPKEILWMLEDVTKEEENKRSTASSTKTYNEEAINALKDTNIKPWKSRQKATNEGGNPNDIGSAMLLNALCNDHVDVGGNLCCSAHVRSEGFSLPQLVVIVVFLVSSALKLFTFWKSTQNQEIKSTNNNNTEAPAQNGAPEKQAMLPEKPDISEKVDVESPAAKTEEANSDKPTEVVIKLTEPVDKPKGGSKAKGTGDKVQGYEELITCMFRMSLILVYFIMCDRQNFFMKEDKDFSYFHFFTPILLCLVLGLVFHQKTSGTAVLNRDQTDEWKGWMQLAILIYHVTGASQVLSIYMQIRVLVSSYLFMSGFGHFYFYFTKGDYSFHRVANVMYRCNLLVVLLCFTMERPYQFYYFVPLVSFWFLICFAAMAIWPQITMATAENSRQQFMLIVLKLGLLFIAITILYISESLFYLLFDNPVSNPLFTLSDGTIREWHFRWGLDRYSTFFGMIFALAMMITKKKGIVEDSSDKNLFSGTITCLIAGLSILGLSAYTLFTWSCVAKPPCNAVHAYISFVPIISFVCLRNVFGWIRVRYSYFFAWWGKISLELFIGQYHIWLASDTQKVLVLVPGNQVINIVVTSFIFVCVAHEIHNLTSRFLPFLIPKDLTLLLRNLFIFAATVVIIVFYRDIIFQ